MPKNVEARILGTSQEFDQKIYLTTSPQNIDGFLDESAKVKSEFLPSYLFGYMRKATATFTSDKTTNQIFDAIDTFVNNEGGEHAGVYVLSGSDITVTVSTGHSVNKSHHASPITSGEFILKAGDWIVLDSYDSGTGDVMFSVVNNTYRDATLVQKGIVQLSSGVSDDQTVAATPKAINSYAEPKFTKNTAFNKNFGTDSTDVAAGDHDHDADYAPLSHTNDSTIHFLKSDVSKADVGLSNVSNDLQATKTEFDAHTGNDDIHFLKSEVSKTDVGLGNVENYGIATLAQSQTGTASNVYMTPERTRQAISYDSGLKIYPSLTAANNNASNHAEGAIVLVEV